MQILDKERKRVKICEGNAQYVYDLGDAAWSSDLPSKNTLDSYISYLATLFSSSGTLWSGSKNNFGYYYFDFSSSSWKYKFGFDSSSRHRADFSSL